jgi:hypothetical protein
MRPKKRILLVDHNEERLSILRYLLTNKGFKVVDIEAEACDLVIGRWPCDNSFVEIAKACCVPSLLLVDRLNSTDAFRLGATQVLSETTPWVIVEWVKHMTALQRGPSPMCLETGTRAFKVLIQQAREGVA